MLVDRLGGVFSRAVAGDASEMLATLWSDGSHVGTS